MSEHGGHLAVGALRVAFGGLPSDRAVRAVLLADTEALAAWLHRLVDERERSAYERGHADGRAASEQSMAEAWTPVAERIRREAGHPAWHELVALRGEEPDGQGRYRSMPRDNDYMGGPLVRPAEQQSRSNAA